MPARLIGEFAVQIETALVNSLTAGNQTRGPECRDCRFEVAS